VHHEAPVRRLAGPEHLADAVDFARAQAPDLLHVHHGMLWPFAAELRATLGVPAAFTVHVHQAGLNRLRRVTERTMSLDGQLRALSEADLVLAPSVACATAVRADHPDLDVVVAGLGVFDTAAARAAVAERVPGAGPVLYVGRFADVKGTRAFFELSRRVLARHPDLEVMVVGGLPDNPRAERRWQRRWAEAAPPELGARLRFAGWCGAEEVSQHLAAARVLVVPSWTETFGLTALEGMLHGAPVVASACLAMVELIDHERTGLLVGVQDDAALHDGVERLLGDDDLAHVLGRAGAAEARGRYAWQQVIGQTVAAYRGALSG
jgi:glycosyltransferase involved in cell wall biosynthesis